MKNRYGYTPGLPALLALLISFVPTALVAAAATEEAAAKDLTYENLVVVENPLVAMAAIDPDVDFSAYKRVAILQPEVAFRNNWQRDQNRSRASRVSSRDMERIKSDVATLFERVFTGRLETAGFEVVDVIGDDVLVIRPAIIELDITAPDTRSPGVTRSFTASTGAATLYVQLFDSVSGAIIGRAIDRQAVRRAGGNLVWSNSVTNTADARRMMGGWADLLVQFLQSQYKEQGQD